MSSHILRIREEDRKDESGRKVTHKPFYRDLHRMVGGWRRVGREGVINESTIFKTREGRSGNMTKDGKRKASNNIHDSHLRMVPLLFQWRFGDVESSPRLLST